MPSQSAADRYAARPHPPRSSRKFPNSAPHELATFNHHTGEPSPSAAQATQDEASAAATFPVVCDTGQPLPVHLQQCLREFKFVELHWFLPAPLLQPSS